MGPFSFLNGAWLVALAAASLPILIHLFSKRRVREVPFSNLNFLDEITKRKIRRIQLRQWILLILRTLAILLIALALSRPVWQGGGFGGGHGSSTVAILIDDSYSMEARLDPGNLLPIASAGTGLEQPTRFSEARQRALQLIDLLDEGDRAILVFTSAPVRLPYGSTVRDPALLREELERAKPRPGRSDLRAALEEVKPILESASTLNKEIFIVSDFQDNQLDEILSELGTAAQIDAETIAGLDPTDSTTDAGAGAGALRLPEGTLTYLLPVIAPSEPNLSLLWAFYERDPATEGGRLTVRMTNYSQAPLEDQLLQLFGGKEETLLAEGFISVAPGATAQAQIDVPEFPEDGLLTVRSPVDLLDRDNQKFVSTSAAERFRVLFVTGGPIADPMIRAEVIFPMLALDPWGAADLLSGTSVSGRAVAEAARREQAAGMQLFSIETIPETELGQKLEITADLVLLLNVGRLSAAAAEKLERYQADGGNVMIALGDRVDPRIYNTQILPRLGQVRLENVVGDLNSETYLSLRPAVAGHAIFDGFPIPPGETLTSARFRRCLDVRLTESANVLAEFSGARPALIEEPGLLLFTSSLDTRWSDFPTSASFLPFLHRALLHQLLRGRIGRHEPLVGERLTLPLAEDFGDKIFHCRGPQGIEIEIEIVQTEQGPIMRSGPIPEPGFYEFRLAHASDDSPALKTFAVNVDTAESDLISASAEKASLLFGDNTLWLSENEEIGRSVREARHGRELWKLCLALAFMALISESLVARGRRLN